jgi:ElaB/YqjD/DUF883 family membrane-anchored ribosome-binding protein
MDTNKMTDPLAGTTASPKQDAASEWSPSKDDQAAQLKAMKADLENLRQTVTAIASSARHVAAARVEYTVADIEETLKRNVFLSVGLAAAIGYVWGRTR